MTTHLDTDVCIVGAGYAGLVAALRLHEAGRSVVVLEARDRIGGRIWSWDTPGGVRIDRGGGWLSERHTVMLDLARRFGVQAYKTYDQGKHLLVDGGRLRPYTGVIPKISPLAVLSIARAQMRLDRMAKQVPLDAPWTAKRATEWDSTTIADWFARAGLRTGVAFDLFESAVRGMFTGPLDDTALLDLLYLVASAGGFNSLVAIKGGYQENLVDGGAGSMAHAIADVLGDAVHVAAPVRRIAQTGDRVTVGADGIEVSAGHVVVTAPPALVREIDFDPAMPVDRAEMYRRVVSGPETKTLVVYDEPFWRADGFSGQTAGPGSASEVTLDASPPVDGSGSHGVIASFTFGDVAYKVDALEPAERRRLVVDELTKRLGPRAANPTEFIETIWWEQEWTRGCSMAHFPPGVITTYGHLLREPMGRVHFAGTETATMSHGAMDGAARSGERAANEILEALA